MVERQYYPEQEIESQCLQGSWPDKCNLVLTQTVASIVVAYEPVAAVSTVAAAAAAENVAAHNSEIVHPSQESTSEATYSALYLVAFSPPVCDAPL